MTTTADVAVPAHTFDPYQAELEQRTEPDGPASLIEPWQAMERARRTMPGRWETPAVRAALLGATVWTGVLAAVAAEAGLISWWVAVMLSVLVAGGVTIGLLVCRWWSARADDLIAADRRFRDACQLEAVR